MTSNDEFIFHEQLCKTLAKFPDVLWLLKHTSVKGEESSYYLKSGSDVQKVLSTMFDKAKKADVTVRFYQQGPFEIASLTFGRYIAYIARIGIIPEMASGMDEQTRLLSEILKEAKGQENG